MRIRNKIISIDVNRGELVRIQHGEYIEGDKEMKLFQDKFKREQSSKGGVCLALFGMAMMGYGIYRGEVSVILEKAINLCMECIGIG